MRICFGGVLGGVSPKGQLAMLSKTTVSVPLSSMFTRVVATSTVPLAATT